MTKPLSSTARAIFDALEPLEFSERLDILLAAYAAAGADLRGELFSTLAHEWTAYKLQRAADLRRLMRAAAADSADNPARATPPTGGAA